ncbi:AraC family transcriptional regulator [Roseibium aestuarii]|uniref:AraC family transcriptional regulator n=1 Tax=Roseibium aestuarii TaxID=2600299 RepID=A0ABW4JUR0_9HYPH|nr:AraC family transcriptional regulator [Roseibium aestuarii]
MIARDGNTREGGGVPEVSVLYVKKMIDNASPACDPEVLYASIGLTSKAAADPSRMIAAEDYYALLETIAAHETGDIRFHMGTSTSMKCEEYGAVGLAFKSAPTLRHSFSRLDRHARAFNKVSVFELADDGDTVRWLHHKREPSRKGLFLSNEGALATIITLCREARSPAFSPKAIHFRHQPLGSEQALADVFRAPITYGAEIDAIVFSTEDVDRPNTVGDWSIWSFFSKHVDDALSEEDAEDALEKEVIQEIADRLSDGVPSLGGVASNLGIGPRTLQRRIADRGKTYQALVDEARVKLAQELLARPKYSLADVAFMTGFSEQSSFTRAFKRWHGLTPKAYRMSLTERAPSVF